VWNLRGRGRSVDLLTSESMDKVAFSPDSRRLLTAGDSAKVVRVWGVDERKNVVLDRFPGGVRALG